MLMKIPRVLSIGLFFALAVGLRAASESWMTDLDAAKARAAKEPKRLLIEFTGSTWCPPCKALHAKVLTSSEFTAFSKDLVLVALDFPPSSERTPEKIKASPELARLMRIKGEYQAPGFPTVLLYDAQGKQLSKVVGYDGSSASVYLATLTAGAK